MGKINEICRVTQGVIGWKGGGGGGLGYWANLLLSFGEKQVQSLPGFIFIQVRKLKFSLSSSITKLPFDFELEYNSADSFYR